MTLGCSDFVLQPNRELIRAGLGLKMPTGQLTDAMFLDDLRKALAAEPNVDPFPRTYLGMPTITQRLPETIPGLTVDEVWLSDPALLQPYST